MKKMKDYLTKEDLLHFSSVLLSDFRSIMADEFQSMFKIYLHPEKKEWLRTKEVVKMLGVSNTTVQNMRISKTLKYTKVGGVVYYNIEDIHLLLRKRAIPRYRKNGEL